MRLAPLLFAPALLSVSALAGAVEHEHTLAVAGNVSSLAVTDKENEETGAGVALHYTYGLSDAFNMVAEVGSSVIALDQRLESPETPRTRPATLTSLGAGAVYVFDVLQLVPYAGVLATSHWLDGGTLAHGRAEVGVALAGGVDYKLSLRWAVGAGVRWHIMLTDTDLYGTYLQGFARVGYTFGR